MKKLLLLAFGMAWGLSVHAAVVTVSWDPPNQYEDGSVLDPLLELERYELGCGNAPDSRAQDVRTWIGDAATMRDEDFPIGVWFCAMRVKAIDSSAQVGNFSTWSNEITFTIAIPARAPLPPVLLGIAVSVP